jgi:hypothetical protein
MAAEGDLAETSKNQIFDSLPVPVPPKRKTKRKNTEECDEMLEKAFTILTSSAAAAATADDECRSFGSFISNKLRNYLPCTRNKVQHEISNIIFTADQGHFDVAYPVPAPSPASQVSSPTTPSSFAGSDDIHLSDLMCI